MVGEQIISMKYVHGYRSSINALIALKSWNHITVYSMGLMDKLSILYSQTFNTHGTVMGMTDFKFENNRNSCIVYGLTRFGRIYF